MIDWKQPDYVPVFQERLRRLAWIRADTTGEVLSALKVFYRDNPAQFIDDWGITIDPKNIQRDLPAVVPFLLFPRQRDWIEEVVAHWKEGRPLLTEKTRQMGFSWLSMALACTLCLFHEGMAIGCGSRKEEYVDNSVSPKSLFYKAREFMRNLPAEFAGQWTGAHMRLAFGNGSALIGEAGNNIGRGATVSIYLVDEAAFLERPELIEASLSQATDCRIDISTPNGMANPFYEKRMSGLIDVFTFHWRDDPRKDEDWYLKQKRELDPVTLAQEVDIDYAASVEGVIIPSAWVQAAVDAHIKLGITPTGERRGAFDVADEGKDKNAFVGGTGILVDVAEEWSGLGSDVFKSTEKVFDLCDEHGFTSFLYDSDGLGAPVRGDARVINERRRLHLLPQIPIVAFRGSAAVFRPEAQDVKGRKNQDYFMNAKAQAWNALRMRFLKTYRAVVEGMDYPAEDLISLDSRLKNLARLCSELSQPTWEPNIIGKMVVDKTPDGVRSPNLADGAMMRFSGFRAPMRIDAKALEAI